MFTKERQLELISRAYGMAKEHGFHDVERSMQHYLMLVLGEVGEAVEADRHGFRANMGGFDYVVGNDEKDFQQAFKTFIKDTVEDELADVCIRLFDMMGALGVEVRSDDMAVNDRKELFGRLYGGETFCERCYTLCALLCRCDETRMQYDGGDGCVPVVLCAALGFICCMCDEMGIDIERHIELKMRYNSLRPIRHGKKY